MVSIPRPYPHTSSDHTSSLFSFICHHHTTPPVKIKSVNDKHISLEFLLLLATDDYSQTMEDLNFSRIRRILGVYQRLLRYEMNELDQELDGLSSILSDRISGWGLSIEENLPIGIFSYHHLLRLGNMRDISLFYLLFDGRWTG